jgi:2,3-bisphosphoglycerate-independent phosphoglycerate mutase
MRNGQMASEGKALLLIRDGWGFSREKKGNAVLAADTPNDDRYATECPTAMIQCTGNAVGNPKGVQGGSEVGHLTIGSGRIVWQPYELINRKIDDGTFFRNEQLVGAIENCKKNNSDLHLSGLFSDQGVHADMRHMFSILKLAKDMSFERVYIHLCLDGRDVPERSALGFVKELKAAIAKIGVGRVASVAGRYYGMDRDMNWDRTRKFYDMLTKGEGFEASDAKEAIEKAYERGDKTDYYVQPTVIKDGGRPVALLKSGDSMIWYNFRSDRARQITAMINGLDYCDEKPDNPVDVHYVCFCSYDDSWDLPVAFPQQKVENNLGTVVSDNGRKQLRIAETEKYAHVTFFFNSQIEKPSNGEKRIMVNSPKVPSYDMKPEMSAYEVTEKLIPEIGKHDLIILNYANPDLVGHSGVFNAVVKACGVVDDCVGRVVEKARKEGYTVLLMADHGNADHMLYDDGSPDPSHGMNPVRLTLISDDPSLKGAKLSDGGMKDIAPTILDIMGIEKPSEMTGESLINR